MEAGGAAAETCPDPLSLGCFGLKAGLRGAAGRLHCVVHVRRPPAAQTHTPVWTGTAGGEGTGGVITHSRGVFSFTSDVSQSVSDLL